LGLGLGTSPSHYGTSSSKDNIVYYTHRAPFPWDFASS